MSNVGYLPDNATIAQWVAAFAEIAVATQPRIVLPCDDMAFRLLARLCRAAPHGMPPSIHARLSSLIEYSLGSATHYEASVDKTRLPGVVTAMGVAVPPFAIVESPPDAELFGRTHGYPIVVKRAHGFAGAGVAICGSADDVAAAFRRFSDAAGAGFRRFAVPTARFGARPRHGPVLPVDGVARATDRRLRERKDRRAPASDRPADRHAPLPVAAIALDRGIARGGFGVSGHFFVEFIVPTGSDRPLVLEINRRITPGSHRGSLRERRSLGGAPAALTGTRSPSRSDFDEGRKGCCVWFPEDGCAIPRADTCASTSSTCRGTSPSCSPHSPRCEAKAERGRSGVRNPRVQRTAQARQQALVRRASCRAVRA